MIHIEGDWYLVEDYSCIDLVELGGVDKNGKQLYKTQKYCSDIEAALKLYAKIAGTKVLFKEDRELLEALRDVKAEYERLSKLFAEIVKL